MLLHKQAINVPVYFLIAARLVYLYNLYARQRIQDALMLTS